jgi:hypothetical protein
MKRSRPWRSDRLRLPRQTHLVGALVLTLVTLLGMTLYQAPPQAHASSAADTNPIIHWDESMIYAGQNNGNPEGPVGETAVVHGSGFTANQSLTLVIVAGDSNNDATICQPPGSDGTAQVGTATTDSSGNFNATFAWPAGVGHVGRTRKNSICAYSSDATLVSSHDDGPFTVLTDNKPSFSLSTTSVAAGNSITITGQNWVPAQPLNITIASCADCDPGSNNVVNATTSSVGVSTGTFSVNVPIPATIAANSYVVNVTSQAGPLDAYHISGLGVKQLTITAAQITPTPTTAPSPSVTASATQTTSATPTSASSGSSSSNGGGSSLVMILLIVFALLLLAMGGIIFFVLAQRKKQEASTSSGAGTAAAETFGAQRTPVTPFPQRQPVSTPGQFSNGANAQLYPGQSQPWQGNPQSNPGFHNFQPPRAYAQQGNGAQGAGMGKAVLNRHCIRCGNPLAPGVLVCGICGTHNAPAPDPNDPTVAF